MQGSETASVEAPKRRWTIGRIVAAFCIYLIAEACLPPRYQPTAWTLTGAINAYQATASPLVGKVCTCRFRPSCSHYGEEAIEKYGTLRGTAATMGRLWRCSPWGPPPGEDLP
jgi:uncharacterized protein